MEKQADISPARDPSIDEGQMAAEKQMRDIGADLYLEVRQYSREELEAERKVVLRKIDWVIMPMVRTDFPTMCNTTITTKLTPYSDLHNIHHPIPRQTLPQLRQRLHPDPRSRSPRRAVRLGRRNLQLRVLILGSSRQLPDSAAPRVQVHR